MQDPDAPVDPQTLPGCGFAAYAVLLVIFGIIGMVGMGSATLSMLQAAEEVGPAKLMPGGQVAVWQMSPMRKAKVVGLTEVPLAWHDESPLRDGTTACALMDDRLVRVQDGRGWTIAYAAIEEIEEQELERGGHRVIAKGTDPDGAPVEVPCDFAFQEGGDKMGRQLRSEQRRARPGAAPSGEQGVDGAGAQGDPDDQGDADLGDGADDPADGGGEGRP
jgi:hypothetical protein